MYNIPYSSNYKYGKTYVHLVLIDLWVHNIMKFALIHKFWCPNFMIFRKLAIFVA